MLSRQLLLTAALLSLSACVGHYRYESTGEVQDADGETRSALLYWYADDGRLWYGKAYQQVDSGVTMLVCGLPSKSFDGAEAGQAMILRSRSGDRQVARADGSNQVIPLQPPVPLRPNSNCGGVNIDGKAVSSETLKPGLAPAVVILCDNPNNRSRYPAAGLYPFKSVSRIKAPERAAPDDYCATHGPD